MHGIFIKLINLMAIPGKLNSTKLSQKPLYRETILKDASKRKEITVRNEAN